MARVRILPRKVRLTLSVQEVAALHALLCRTGPKTNLLLADDTLDVFSKLDEVRSDLEEQGIGRKEFERYAEFRKSTRDLRDVR